MSSADSREHRRTSVRRTPHPPLRGRFSPHARGETGKLAGPLCRTAQLPRKITAMTNPHASRGTMTTISGDYRSSSSSRSASRSPPPERSGADSVEFGQVFANLSAHDVVVVDMEFLFGVQDEDPSDAQGEDPLPGAAVVPPAPPPPPPVATFIPPPPPAPVVVPVVVPVAGPPPPPPAPAAAAGPPPPAPAAAAGPPPPAPVVVPVVVPGPPPPAHVPPIAGGLFLGPPNWTRAGIGWTCMISGTVGLTIGSVIAVGAFGSTEAFGFAWPITAGILALLLAGVLLGLQYCRAPAPVPAPPPHVPQAR
jgi:hypothetical protein